MGLFGKKENYPCSECVEKFSKQKELFEHAVNTHHRIIVKCSLCKTSVIQENVLNHTRRNHHKVSLFWRILFSWSPLAYWHINKVLLAIAVGIPFYISLQILDRIPDSESLNDIDFVVLDVMFIVVAVLSIVVPALLMWKWATAWNRKVDEIEKTGSQI